MGTCPNCRKHVLAREAAHVIYNDGPAAPNWRYSILICDECGGPLVIYGEDGHSFTEPIWLYPSVDELSDRIPAQLRVELAEAKVLSLSGHNLPAVLLCGRVLEGLAVLHSVQERSLLKSLERMQAEGLISVEMLEWAQALRVLRNVAAHFGTHDEISTEDVDDAIALTEAILEHVYLFAHRFRAFKARRTGS